MWVALYIGLFWIALSIVLGVLWGVLKQGWAPYWRNVGSLFRRNPPFEEYGDLSEGR